MPWRGWCRTSRCRRNGAPASTRWSGSRRRSRPAGRRCAPSCRPPVWCRQPSLALPCSPWSGRSVAGARSKFGDSTVRNLGKIGPIRTTVASQERPHGRRNPFASHRPAGERGARPPPPRPGARRDRRCPTYDRARRHHRERGAAADSARARIQRRRPRVDGHCLFAGLRQPAAARRPPGRPLRPPQGLHHWRARLFDGLARRGLRDVRVVVAHSTRRARRRGRAGCADSPLDIPGVVTSTAGLALLVYGLTHAAAGQDGVSHWGASVTIASLVAAAALLVSFVFIERRSDHAELPLHLLGSRRRSGAYVMMLLLGTAMFAVFFFLTLYIQTVWGYSSVKAGVAWLPFPISLIALNIFVARYLVTRVGVRPLLMAGPLFAGAGFLWLSRLSETGSYWKPA